MELFGWKRRETGSKRIDCRYGGSAARVYNHRVHIAIDARLPYYERGGISQYVLHLIPALLALGSDHRYTILKSRKERGRYLADRDSAARERPVWTPCHHRLERWALGIEMIPMRADLLHSPDFIPPAFGAKRNVITVHDLNFLRFPEFLDGEARRHYAGQIRWAVERADHISADSHHTRRELVELLEVPADKISVVHLAANPLFSAPMPESAVQAVLDRHGLTRGFVLFVGTLSPRKNLLLLLNALPALPPELRDEVRLVLAGRPGWRAEEVFAAIRDNHLADRVRHLPDLTDGELAALYRAAAVLAYPSVYEGFGLPPLEAMASGCPVVASTAAAVPEVVGDAGLLIEPSDPAAWADALAQVLSDSALRAGMVARGLERARRFSWDQTAQATVAIYERVAG